MKGFLNQTLFFFISTLYIAVHAANETLVMNGEGSITQGYPETIYTAHKYRPICGTLALSQPEDRITVGDTCSNAMLLYRGTTDTFALYTQSGVRQSDSAPIGQGSELCMCYSLGNIVNGKQGSFCVLVHGEGTVERVFGFLYVTGIFEMGNKALPQCFDINVASVTSSIDAAGSATHIQVNGPTRSVDPANAPTGSSSNPSSNGNVGLFFIFR